MKKLALTLAIGIFSLGAVSAQTGKKEGKKTELDANRKHHQKKSPEERASHMAAKLAKDLNLSDAQSAKIKEAVLRKNSQMQALKAKHGENRDAMKADMKAVKTTWHNDLKSILTAEQMSKYEAMKADQKAKHKGKHNGKHQGKKGEHKLQK